MSKITKVIIIDSHTLKLDKDAQKGDVIDLLSLDSIDTMILSKKIDEFKDNEYNRRLEQLKKEMLLEKENEIQKAVKQSQDEIVKLEEKIKSQENTLRVQLSADYNIQIERLKHQLKQLENEKNQIAISKDNEIKLAISNKINEIKDEINSYQNQINQLEKDKTITKEKFDLEKTLAIQNKEKELSETIQEKEKIIARLALEKTNMNIKKMGEELETWVDQEFQNHALNGFENCLWEKDNEVVRSHGETKGTKADYIFKVFSEETKEDKDLLTSVAIEIKSEDPNSTYKKKNSDHYDKLDKDRQKKNCEYALLISELEWTSTNDAPIRKVQGYDKMYMVRPQYFIVFLNIVTALGLKYKDIIQKHDLERKKFKDSEDILVELEQMKSDILDKSIVYIQNKMDDIISSAVNIENEAKKILEASRIIMETHINTVINKIKNFKIHQMIKKIDKIEE